VETQGRGVAAPHCIFSHPNPPASIGVIHNIRVVTPTKFFRSQSTCSTPKSAVSPNALHLFLNEDTRALCYNARVSHHRQHDLACCSINTLLSQKSGKTARTAKPMEHPLPHRRTALAYSAPQPTHLATWLSSLSVFCITLPAFFAVAILIAAFIDAPPSLIIALEILATAGPILGVSFALTALLQKTPTKRTAIAGLIGCSLWILIIFAPALIKIGSSPTISPRPIVRAPAAPR
jgi:hypothetical protein